MHISPAAGRSAPALTTIPHAQTVPAADYGDHRRSMRRMQVWAALDYAAMVA